MQTVKQQAKRDIGAKNRKKILILSDDSQLAMSLSLFFGDEFEVKTVEHFNDAREIIKRNEADLLLVDFGVPDDRMPVSLGNLKDRNENIPMILMYVFHERKKPVDVAIRKLADAVFYKPVNLLDVLGQIRVFLS
jgi:DNA-binding NtrC family response regulator